METNEYIKSLEKMKEKIEVIYCKSHMISEDELDDEIMKIRNDIRLLIKKINLDKHLIMKKELDEIRNHINRINEK